MLWLAACVVAGELTAAGARGAPRAATPGEAAAPNGSCSSVATAAGGTEAAEEEEEGVEQSNPSRGRAEGKAGVFEGGGRSEGKAAATVIFCDGVSAPVPFLRLAGPVRCDFLFRPPCDAPPTHGKHC